MTSPLNKLLTALSDYPASDTVFNPYTASQHHGRARLANLRGFLEHRMNADTLMLLEAPGYRGCRITGIPVTSRRVMATPALHGGIFQPMPDDQVEPDFRAYASEQSATILWQALADRHATPLLWNTFPFHPHQPAKLHSNRTPRPAEIRAGLAFLEQVLALSSAQTFVAVGNVASRALTTLGVTHHAVRHPAQGGKNDFVRGMNTVFGEGMG